ncbi:MAG TPA: ATP-dependent zinc metalloprotease FtsH [Pontiellaceae bacterium]|nr:ATP-dependent zinc metalloprotease FtsH [Pontiellaceae bacterium]HPR82769.1 ATP-dependent zinc metalloprotease FtsH [Pontiellaceae bacterium]
MENENDKPLPPEPEKGGAPRKKLPQVKPPMPMKGFAAWFLLMALVLMALQFFQKPEQTEQTSYNPDFVQMVKSGRIISCEIVRDTSGNDYIAGELTAVDGKTGAPKKFRVDVVVTEDLLKMLQENNVTFKVRAHSPFWQVFWNVAPFIIGFLIIYFFFFRQMKMAGGRAMSFGKSRAKLLQRDDKNRTTFADVAGVDEAKEELQEVVEFLKNPKQFQRLGGKMPKGVLLAGSPGTGKTLIARAVAGEADVPFFSISGSDFVEMFVGVGASRVRDMFEQGRKSAPCIIFIDEIDAVGRSRFSGMGGGHDEREQTLNALLVEMDGFDTTEGVIIIAATNRPDVLDPALMRPGRFDRQVFIDLPNLKGREEILNIHVKRVTLAKDVDLTKVARGTPGFSGADLMNLVNEAALLAARRGAEAVDLPDFEEARDKVSWGRERRSHMLDAEEKKLTAYHEAGHAIVLAKTEQTEPVHKVTVIPRGRALGATMQLPEKDRYTQGRKRLMGMLIGLMGGRAAEELIFGDVTTGAQNDIERATRIARAMVCEFGMSETLGPRNYGSDQEQMFLGREISRSEKHSEQITLKIDEEIDSILKEAHKTATNILKEHRDRLELIAELLIKYETLDGEQVMEILKTGKAPEELLKNGNGHAAAPVLSDEVKPAEVPPAE